MSKIYNKEIKEKFLSIYDNEGTQATLRHVFSKSYPEEYRLNKDLATFTLDDIKETIKEANPHNLQTAKSLVRFVKQYVSWGVEVGLRKSNILSFDAITDEWYEGLIDKSKKIHYSESEFLLLLQGMMNAQDQSFLCLVFEGIVGQSFSELKSLHFSDIDWNTHEIYVKERNETVRVSENCIKYLDKAYKEKTYFSYNVKTKEHNEKELLPSEFIFKNIKSPRSKEYEMVNHTVFYNRLNSLREEFALQYLTPNALKQSGMLKMSVDLYEEYGKLDYEQLSKIGDKYKYSTVTSNGYSYYNTSMMKEFISEENIKNLYNIDIQF